jgi:hypothetical protein
VLYTATRYSKETEVHQSTRKARLAASQTNTDSNTLATVSNAVPCGSFSDDETLGGGVSRSVPVAEAYNLTTFFYPLSGLARHV